MSLVKHKACGIGHDTRTKLRTWHGACDCIRWCMCVSLSLSTLCACIRAKGAPARNPPSRKSPAACEWHETFFFSFSFFFFFFFFPPFASPYLKYLLYTLSTCRLIRSKLGYRHRHRHHYPIWLLLFANVAAILPSSPLLPLPPSAPPFWTS